MTLFVPKTSANFRNSNNQRELESADESIEQTDENEIQTPLQKQGRGLVDRKLVQAPQ